MIWVDLLDFGEKKKGGAGHLPQNPYNLEKSWF